MFLCCCKHSSERAVWSFGRNLAVRKNIQRLIDRRLQSSSYHIFRWVNLKHVSDGLDREKDTTHNVRKQRKIRSNERNGICQMFIYKTEIAWHKWIFRQWVEHIYAAHGVLVYIQSCVSLVRILNDRQRTHSFFFFVQVFSNILHFYFFLSHFVRNFFFLSNRFGFAGRIRCFYLGKDQFGMNEKKIVVCVFQFKNRVVITTMMRYLSFILIERQANHHHHHHHFCRIYCNKTHDKKTMYRKRITTIVDNRQRQTLETVE